MVAPSFLLIVSMKRLNVNLKFLQYVKKHQYAFGFLAVAFVWIFADSSYRNNVQKNYLQCIFNEASSEAKSGVNIYEDYQFDTLRENCAKSQGIEYFEIGKEVGIDWLASPILKKILIFPTFLAIDNEFFWWSLIGKHFVNEKSNLMLGHAS